MDMNKDVFDTEEKLRYAMEEFAKLVKERGLLCNTEIHSVAKDPVKFVYKSADTALRKELAVGALVQTKVNTNSGSKIVYGLVTGVQHSGCGSQLHFDRVRIATACGEVVVPVFASGPKPADFDVDVLLVDQIKLADVPQEIMELMKPNFANCPLKNEGACMAGEPT